MVSVILAIRNLTRDALLRAILAAHGSSSLRRSQDPPPGFATPAFARPHHRAAGRRVRDGALAAPRRARGRAGAHALVAEHVRRELRPRLYPSAGRFPRLA